MQSERALQRAGAGRPSRVVEIITPRSARFEKGKDRASKYMNDVGSFPYLHHFVHALSFDATLLPKWERKLVKRIKESLQLKIDENLTKDAIARQKLQSIDPAVWKERNGYFNLTEKPRKILGYLSKTVLKELDNLVRLPLEQEIQNYRAKLKQYLHEMRASKADMDSLSDIFERNTVFLVDLEDHVEQYSLWHDLYEQKIQIIRELEARECFLHEMQAFEARITESKKGRLRGRGGHYHDANTLVLNQVNGFRKWAAGKAKLLDLQATQMCITYEATTGRVFQIDGINYQQMIVEQQFGRPKNMTTSLSKLSVEFIPLDARQEYSGVRKTVYLDQNTPLKISLYEQGVNTDELIRNGPIKALLQAIQNRPEFTA